MDRAAHPLARPLKVAVVGAGWAGLAAAVRASQRGAQVALFEMAPAAGGRASSPRGLDNGAHILIGAYTATLDLMRSVGAEPERLLRRTPLDLRDAQGHGLALPPGSPAWSFARGVLGWRALSLGERLALLRAALGWWRCGFACPPAQTVAQWAAPLPPTVRRALIEPLCVAALNTPPEQASARVLLRVLRDALLSGPGSADLLLPRVPLAQLLPVPALAWLAQQGVTVRMPARVQRLAPQGDAWTVDGQRHDAVVLACTAREAARLVAPHAPDWAGCAGDLAHTAIATVWLQAPGLRWPSPMVALSDGPAQFGFDLGALLGQADHYACSISHATEAELPAAVAAQFQRQFGAAPRVVAARTERRATLACTPQLLRPPARIAPQLWAAGDYVAGPYPSTLEGAVRSGLAVADALA